MRVSNRKQPESPDFDQALDEVEKIIARIESGEIGLEQSITEYERGAALLRLCRERLMRAEQKVKDLTAQLHPDPAAGEPPRAGDVPEGGGDEGPERDNDMPF